LEARTLLSDWYNVRDIQSDQFLAFGKANYQPARRSTLIDAGTVLAPFTDGFKGQGPDVGAYEFGQHSFAAGASRKRVR